MKRIAIIALLLVVCLHVAADDKPVTISGYLFGDSYYLGSNHDPALEGKNGFWVRRAYVTFDRALSDSLAARLRFEMNSPGDFKTNATLEPYVKDAYVKWKQSPKMDLVVGISPTPTWELIEKVWGYRSVEKTPVDLHRMGSSRDFGIALTGAFDDAKNYRYHIIVGNGSGTGSETNDGKKVAFAVSTSPVKAVTVELYADRDDRPGDTDRTLLQAFAALQRERYRAGLQYAHQQRDGEDLSLDVASAFVVYDLRENISLLGRVDRMFDPNPEGDRIPYLPFDKTSKSTLFLGGVDWKVHKSFSVIPNVEVVTYDDGGSNDIVPRVTFFYTF